MEFKIIFFIFILLITNCSIYYKFDELYDQENYLKAYKLIENIQDKNDSHYQKRLLQSVIRLSLDGDKDFINKLQNIIENDNLDDKLTNYILFARNLLIFMNADSVSSYYFVLSNFQNLKSLPEEFLPISLKLRGISYYKVGNYENALKDLIESQNLRQNLENLYFIGLCYQNMDDFKNAKIYFEKLKEYTTNSNYISLAYFQLGELSYYQNNIKDALDLYIKAINSYSLNANYSDQIGKSLLKLKYNKLGQKFFKISLRIQKDDANAWFYLNLY